jgi:hypothetical protein
MKFTWLIVTCLIIGSVQSNPIIKIRATITKWIQDAFKIGSLQSQYAVLPPLRDLYFEQLESFAAAVRAARPNETNREPWRTLQANITRQRLQNLQLLSGAALGDWFTKFRVYLERFFKSRIEILSERFMQGIIRSSAILVDRCWEITHDDLVTNQISRKNVRVIYDHVGRALRDRFFDLYNDIRRIARLAAESTPPNGREGDFVSEIC